MPDWGKNVEKWAVGSGQWAVSSRQWAVAAYNFQQSDSVKQFVLF
jgi:hypothetical protein